MSICQGTTLYSKQNPLQRVYVRRCQHTRYSAHIFAHVVPLVDSPHVGLRNTYIERDVFNSNAQWLNQFYTTRRKSRRNALLRVMDTAAFALAMQPKRHLPRSTFTGRDWGSYKSLTDLVGAMQ